MVAPKREKCGVADYSEYLLQELRQQVDVAYETDAEGFAPEMNRVDIVHIQHQYFLFGGVAPWKNWFHRFANKIEAPAVMTVHEFVTPEGNAARKRAIKLTNQRQFRHPAIRRLIVHTESDRARLVEDGISAECIDVIRHGIPRKPILPDRDSARSSLILDSKFVLTIFGFIAQKKGYTLAIEALKGLPNEVTLLIAGGRHPDDKTAYPAMIEDLIRNQNMSKRVRITGYLPDLEVARVMSATDVVLAPFSESSGSGSLAMAFACGKAIIASDIAPHQEIQNEKPGALELIHGGDAAALAESIMKLRSDNQRLSHLGQDAVTYADSHTYARAAEETVGLYRRVLFEASA
jgi:glycosyltransferase involved in cell wall biosynthesis